MHITVITAGKSLKATETSHEILQLFLLRENIIPKQLTGIKLLLIYNEENIISTPVIV